LCSLTIIPATIHFPLVNKMIKPNLLDSIARPTLLLNEIQARENIRVMSEKARVSGVDFRPHFKTHQSIQIGRWFRDVGTTKITVSSVDMAAYFASDGWDDITIAFPLNYRQLPDIAELALDVNLGILVESVDAVSALGRLSPACFKIWIKIDCGLHRTGVSWRDLPTVKSILNEVSRHSNLRAAGLLTHAGNTYSARSPEEALSTHLETNKMLRQLRENMGEPGLSISVGDTPGLSLSTSFIGVDEVRPGNFIFFDAEQLEIGSCSPDQITVALACPIVAVHPDRNEVVLYGGAVHLSKEAFLHDGMPSYGLAAESLTKSWGHILPGCSILRVSQEHGILNVPPEMLNRFTPGNLAMVIPTHSCLTAHLMRRYTTLDGKTIEMMPI
jgi:D-serine deaminase-like pyridoxal phosphate-dependent protein